MSAEPTTPCVRCQKEAENSEWEDSVGDPLCNACGRAAEATVAASNEAWKLLDSMMRGIAAAAGYEGPKDPGLLAEHITKLRAADAGKERGARLDAEAALVAVRLELAELRGDRLATEVAWERNDDGCLEADCGVLSVLVDSDEAGIHAVALWDGDSAEEAADSTEDAKRKAIAIARNLLATAHARLRELERELPGGPK